MTAKKMTVMLTAKEARLVWGLLDGAMDAGACDGGLSKAEHSACCKVVDALSDHMNQKGKSKRGDE